MCGIFFSAVKDKKQESISDDVLACILRRGPDKSSKCNIHYLNWTLNFFGSVLWMQGKEPVLQPAIDTNGNILLWNGDILDGQWITKDGESDTSVVLSKVFGYKLSEESILKSLSMIRGPYAFAYWCQNTKKLWFGRDRIGRHSLLWYFGDNQFILSSVGKRQIEFMEVPVIGIFVASFAESFSLTVYPWSDIEKTVFLHQQAPFQISSLTVDSPIHVKCPQPYNPSADYDDLINVNCNTRETFFEKLLENKDVSERVDILLQCLRNAVRLRCKTQIGMCKDCLAASNCSLKHDMKCNHPKIGILFSGGLDSTILAALTHECVDIEDPIDLFNVAFENGNKQYNTPDRNTGIQSFKELHELFPNRQWNFIQINISKHELNSLRKSRICDLIHPLNSVLDDSLGCALWFASRLCGELNDVEYLSPARVLLLGMGADEQFGGYMRHRTILRYKGWSALSEEIDVELQRISARNLGRDDRIVADHGCQARFPFLDEEVINFVNSLPVWERCYPTSVLPPGFGDKLLLRLVAWKCGLKKAAQIPKRAFQFGSRIANGKEKASDISSRLNA